MLLNQLWEDVVLGLYYDVMMREWCVRDIKVECKVCYCKSVNYVINIWDFKGCDDLYSVYQCFLLLRILFLVVYDVSKGISEIDVFKFWFFNIYVCVLEVFIMFVGIYKDKVLKDQVFKLLNEIKVRVFGMCVGVGFFQVKIYVVFDCI